MIRDHVLILGLSLFPFIKIYDWTRIFYFSIAHGNSKTCMIASMRGGMGRGCENRGKNERVKCHLYILRET